MTPSTSFAQLTHYGFDGVECAAVTLDVREESSRTSAPTRIAKSGG